MYKYLFRQWKKRKATMLLIVFGFFIGSLVMSIGISNCYETALLLQDRKMGNPEEQLFCDLISEEKIDVNQVSELVNKLADYGAVQILNIVNDHIAVVPVIMKSDDVWKVPVIEGEFLTSEGILSGRNDIVIGKSIAESKGIKCGDEITIFDKEYKVVGICGRVNRETSWEHAVYVPYGQFVDRLNQMNIKNYSIWASSGKDAILKQDEDLQHLFGEQTLLSYREAVSLETSSFDNSIIIAAASTILVFVIAIINIIQLLLYWVIDRKRELGIMKALGAGNKYIICSMVLETTVLAAIGSILSLIVQGVMSRCLVTIARDTGIGMDLNIFNLVLAISITILFGLLAVIVPIKRAINADPVRIINHV